MASHCWVPDALGVSFCADPRKPGLLSQIPPGLLPGAGGHFLEADLALVPQPLAALCVTETLSRVPCEMPLEPPTPSVR
jgi:hypothetical protein